MFWFSCVSQITSSINSSSCPKMGGKKAHFLKCFSSLSLCWINFKLWFCTSRNLIHFLTMSHVRNRPAEINANWVGDKCNHSKTIPPWWNRSHILAKYNTFLSSSSSSYFSNSNTHYSPLTNSETDSPASLGVGTLLHGSSCSCIISIPAVLRGLQRQAGQKCKLLILPQ